MKNSCADCPVPVEQQPMNEYLNLKQSMFFFWTTREIKAYLKSTLLFSFFTYLLTIMLISASQPTLSNNQNLFIYMFLFGNVPLGLWFLRLYLAWLYVYDRLVKASVSYEESGWYDGQVWVKSTRMLVQDRLVAEYQLIPILKRLKLTISGLCIIFFIGILYLKICA